MPRKFKKDMAFFDICREKGLLVRKVLEQVVDRLMFEDDEGDETLRRTVYGFEVTWPGGVAQSDASA